MTRTALIARALVACAALLTATAPAFAGEAPAAVTRTSDSAARIVVSLCERDALTQAAFRNQHGPRPVYVTADQVMMARASGERWSESRCMTTGEHQRLTQRLSARTAL